MPPPIAEINSSHKPSLRPSLPQENPLFLGLRLVGRLALRRLGLFTRFGRLTLVILRELGLLAMAA
jgi:hypothetical protein